MTKDESLTYTPIDQLPEFSGRKGPRESMCLSAYRAAMKSASGKVEVGGTAEGVDRFYRSMVQWRARHKSEPVRVRKDGPRVFVWVEDTQAGKRDAVAK